VIVACNVARDFITGVACDVAVACMWHRPSPLISSPVCNLSCSLQAILLKATKLPHVRMFSMARILARNFIAPIKHV
jgi:hypothetical protein